MRLLGYILAFFMTYSAIVYAQADICDLTKSCTIAVEDCHDEANHQESTSSTDMHHEHCNMHCAHYFFYYQYQNSFVQATVESPYLQSYTFNFSQAILETPFRPPLV